MLWEKVRTMKTRLLVHELCGLWQAASVNMWQLAVIVVAYAPVVVAVWCTDGSEVK